MTDKFESELNIPTELCMARFPRNCIMGRRPAVVILPSTQTDVFRSQIIFTAFLWSPLCRKPKALSCSTIYKSISNKTPTNFRPNFQQPVNFIFRGYNLESITENGKPLNTKMVIPTAYLV